jgi:hypothetical protein
LAGLTDDELLLIYKGLRDMNEAMKAREIALDQKTAALGAAIAQLEKMPFALGKQTSQYIGMGVREAIQQDFDTPIKESFQVPIANLERATSEARNVMREVGKATRFHAVSWWGSVLGLGILLGALGYHFLEMRKFDDIQTQLNTIQQQIALPAPAQDAKPGDGKTGKGKKGH